MVTWPWPRPFQGRFFIGRVGLAMVNQCTKFEISRFTRYEAMNSSAKCRKWGGLGQLGGTQGHGQCHHSTERMRLPIWLQWKLQVCVYLLPFSRYSQLFVESRRFWPTPPAFGVTVVEFRRDLLHQKTRVPTLSCGVICVILRLAVLVEHRLVTDRHRRTQTHGYSTADA